MILKILLFLLLILIVIYCFLYKNYIFGGNNSFYEFKINLNDKYYGNYLCTKNINNKIPQQLYKFGKINTEKYLHDDPSKIGINEMNINYIIKNPGKIFFDSNDRYKFYCYLKNRIKIYLFFILNEIEEFILDPLKTVFLKPLKITSKISSYMRIKNYNNYLNNYLLYGLKDDNNTNLKKFIKNIGKFLNEISSFFDPESKYNMINLLNMDNIINFFIKLTKYVIKMGVIYSDIIIFKKANIFIFLHDYLSLFLDALDYQYNYYYFDNINTPGGGTFPTYIFNVLLFGYIKYELINEIKKKYSNIINYIQTPRLFLRALFYKIILWTFILILINKLEDLRIFLLERNLKVEKKIKDNKSYNLKYKYGNNEDFLERLRYYNNKILINILETTQKREYFNLIDTIFHLFYYFYITNCILKSKPINDKLLDDYTLKILYGIKYNKN